MKRGLIIYLGLLVLIFCLDAVDFRQEHLQEQIVKYLEKQLENAESDRDRKNRQEVVQEARNSKGFCAGLGTLWSYGKRIQKDVKSAPDIMRDDEDFFIDTVGLLSEWDGESFFTPEQERQIDRFIANILLYQQQTWILFEDAPDFKQFHLDISLDDTKRGRPILVFNETAVLDKEALQKRLKEVIKPHCLIFLTYSNGINKDLGGHVVMVYQDFDGKMFFYDPNFYKGPVAVESFDDLASKYWGATSPGIFNEGGREFFIDTILRIVGIKIFKFSGDRDYKYSSSKDFKLSLEEINTLLQNYGKWLGNEKAKLRDDVKELFEQKDELEKSVEAVPVVSQKIFVPVNPAPVPDVVSPVPVQVLKTPSYRSVSPVPAPRNVSPAPAVPARKAASPVPAASVRQVVPVNSLRKFIEDSYSDIKTGFESDDDE